MDVGPCTEGEHYLSQPIDDSVLQNILDMTRNMSPSERLALFSGFVRYTFEVMQIIMETVVTGKMEGERRWDQEANDQLCREEQEEADILRVVKQFEEEQRAAEYQAWEDRAMQEEMDPGFTSRSKLAAGL